MAFIFKKSDFPDSKAVDEAIARLQAHKLTFKKLEDAAEALRTAAEKHGVSIEDLKELLFPKENRASRGSGGSTGTRSKLDNTGLVEGTTYVNPNPGPGDKKEWTHPASGRRPQFVKDAVADGSIAKLAKK